MDLDLDLGTLLAPLEGESRGGRDLRDDEDPNNAYRRIRDARNEAREEERQADLSGETGRYLSRQWADVWEHGVEYLSTIAKDLEIVAYMIEASVRLGGFAGLARSVNLTRYLVEEFWGELLPTPDEDGIETTIRPIARLNGDVIVYPLARVPVTLDTSDGEFMVWQYTQARQLQSLSGEEQEERISRGAVTVEQFARSVVETTQQDPQFYPSLMASLQEAREAVNLLVEAFEERVDDEFVPNVSKFLGSLDEAESVIRQIAGDVLEAAEATDEAATEDGAAAEDGAGGAPAQQVKGGLATREDAFRLLEDVARWFEKNEPQSILPSEIRNCIRRGRMTPVELYMDLIRDESVRDQLFRDVGIHIRDDESSEY